MATVTVIALLLLVAVGLWLIWRTRKPDAAPTPPAYDLNALLSPYRERFEALQNTPGARDPQRRALLEQAYTLAREGSALLARIQVSGRTAELPVSAMEALQNQLFEMRERREAVDSELADLSRQLAAPADHLNA